MIIELKDVKLRPKYQEPLFAPELVKDSPIYKAIQCQRNRSQEIEIGSAEIRFI